MRHMNLPESKAGRRCASAQKLGEEFSVCMNQKGHDANAPKAGMKTGMMMEMHHEQALDMAKMELAHGKSAEMKAMASKIISGQKKEIAQFDRWMAKQK